MMPSLISPTPTDTLTLIINNTSGDRGAASGAGVGGQGCAVTVLALLGH